MRIKFDGEMSPETSIWKEEEVAIATNPTQWQL
jgi:hypothetical protein